MSEPDAPADGESVAKAEASSQPTTRRQRHPFQRIAYIRPEDQDQYGLFLIAHRLILMVVDSRNGVIIAEWDGESSQSKGVITLLEPDQQGRHVALATSEDKAVHILSISREGLLWPLNKRILPKRPCCLCWTPDDEHVLAGDKFGDVYDLPLQVPALEISSAPKEEPSVSAKEQASLSQTDTPTITTGDEMHDSIVRGFKPSATELTVHSGRNRRALENQQRTAAGKHDQKKEIDASLKVVLGHVSMLTAILSRRVPMSRAVEGADTFWRSPEQNEAWKEEVRNGKYRDYIITADRDEHIRVSRGLPQAHIIENFCLGHTSFVSALCIPEEFEASNLLFSGGGDDWIGCWNWLRGELICKLSLRIPDAPDRKIAVSGMWSSPPANGSGMRIVVAIEGLKAYFVIKSSDWNPTSAYDFYITFHKVNGVILDTASVTPKNMLLSYDNSTSTSNEPEEDFSETQANPRLRVLRVNDTIAFALASDPEPVQIPAKIDWMVAESMSRQELEHEMQESDDALINDLFCGVERMRKRAGYGDD